MQEFVLSLIISSIFACLYEIKMKFSISVFLSIDFNKIFELILSFDRRNRRVTVDRHLFTLDS